MISAYDAREILYAGVDKTLVDIYQLIKEAAQSAQSAQSEKTFITVPQDNLSRLQMRRLFSLDYCIEAEGDTYNIVF